MRELPALPLRFEAFRAEDPTAQEPPSRTCRVPSASGDRRSLQLKIAHRDLQRHGLGAGIVRDARVYASTSQGRYNPLHIRRGRTHLQQVWPAAQKPWPHRRLLLPDACLARYAPPVAIWRIFPPSLSRDISRPPRPSISLALDKMKAGTEQKLQDNEVVTYHVVDVVGGGSMA